MTTYVVINQSLFLCLNDYLIQNCRSFIDTAQVLKQNKSMLHFLRTLENSIGLD